MPSAGQVQDAVTGARESTTGRRRAGFILQVTGRSVRPVGTGVGRGLGASAPLVIKRLQGSRHGRLINAVVDLKIVRLLIETGGIDVIGAGSGKSGKINPPDGVAGNAGGIGSLAGDIARRDRISECAGGGVIDADGGAGIRGEISDLIIARPVPEIVDLDMPENGRGQ